MVPEMPIAAQVDGPNSTATEPAVLVQNQGFIALITLNRADNRNFQRVMGENAGFVVDQVVARDGSQRFKRSAARVSIGMARKSGCKPGAIGHCVGIVCILKDRGDKLRADALEGFLVETRLVQREFEHVEGFGLVADQCA